MTSAEQGPTLLQLVIIGVSLLAIGLNLDAMRRRRRR